jgi:hypothetical protein
MFITRGSIGGQGDQMRLRKKLPKMQGCQMVYFHTKNHNLGKFWRPLEWKKLVYFMTIENILRPFGMVCPVLVCLDQEKSGNLPNPLFVKIST